MNRTFAEDEVILRKLEWLWWKPLLIGELYNVLGRPDLVSEVIFWAEGLHNLLRDSGSFRKECLQDVPSACLDAKGLKRGLLLWHKHGNPKIDAGDFFEILNEFYGLPKSNTEWPGLSLLLPELWESNNPAAGDKFGAKCPPEPSCGLTPAEFDLLKKIAWQKLNSASNKKRHTTIISGTGVIENGFGISIQVPPGLTVPPNARAFVLNKEEIEHKFDKGTRFLKSYRTSVANLYVLDEMLVHKLSLDDAIEQARAFGYDSSLIDRQEMSRMPGILRTNGNSKHVGDSLVLVECWFFRRSPEEAILVVQRAGFLTASKSQFHRLLGKLLKETARHAPSSGIGD